MIRATIIASWFLLLLSACAWATPDEFEDSSGTPWINWEAHDLPSYGTTQPTTQPASNTAWVIVYCRYFPTMQYTGSPPAPSVNNLNASGYGPFVYPTSALAWAEERRGDYSATAGLQTGVASTRVYMPNFEPLSGSPITPDGVVYVDWNGSVANPGIAIDGDVIDPERVLIAAAVGAPGLNMVGSSTVFTIRVRWYPQGAWAGVPDQLIMVIQKVEGPEGGASGSAATQPDATTQPIHKWTPTTMPLQADAPIYHTVPSTSATITIPFGIDFMGFVPTTMVMNFSAYQKASYPLVRAGNAIVTAFTACICAYWVLQEFRRQ